VRGAWHVDTRGTTYGKPGMRHHAHTISPNEHGHAQLPRELLRP